MAVDPTNIDNTINASIYPNGRGLITGASLASVLVAITAWVVMYFQPLLGFTPVKTINVIDYGATCNGTGTGDTAGFNAAIAAANALTTGSKISVPQGECVVAGALTPITATGTSVEGAGQYSSWIVQQTDNVVTFTWQSTSPTTQDLFGGALRNIWIRRVAASTGGTGVKLVRVNGFSIANVDIRDFYTDLGIYGGSGIGATNLNMSAGLYFGGFQSGSSLLHFYAAAAGASWEAPGEISFSSFDWKGATNGYLDNAVVFEGGDGIFFSSGHLGFAANNQILFSPQTTNLNVQSVHFTGVYTDGNLTGQTGVNIPAVGPSGAKVVGISYVGGEISDLQGDGFQVDSTTAQFRVDTNFNTVNGWSVFNNNSALSQVSGTFANVGANGAGAIHSGNVGVANYYGISIINGKTGQTCIPAASGGTIHTFAVVTDGSCS